LAVVPECVETPLLTGRVVAALFAEAQVTGLKRSGAVVVGAEVARELGVVDVSGGVPPSVRSVKFLLPAVVLGRMQSPSKQLADLLYKLSPDVLLPMAFMAGGPPE
jgi:hypothetical protein